MTIDEQCLTGQQLVHLISLHVHGSLYGRTFRCHDNDFVVLVPEGCTYTPRVAYGKGLATTRDALDHVATIPNGTCGAQHIGHIEVLFYVFGNLAVLLAHQFGNAKHALHLTVEAVAHVLKQEVAVGKTTRMLALFYQFVIYLLVVDHREVAAESQVLGLPVVATEEGMHVGDATLARGRVAQVTHIELTGKRHVHRSEIRVVNLFAGIVLGIPFVCSVEYFGDGA